MDSHMNINDQGLTITVYTVAPHALVGDVASLMVTHGVGDAIVMEEGKPVGILTDRDLVTRVMAAGLDGTTLLARDIMSAPPVTIPRNEEVSTAIALMSHHGIRRLPIIDEAGKLVSILTLDDIIMLSLNGQPELSNIVRRQLRLGDAPPAITHGAAPYGNGGRRKTSCTSIVRYSREHCSFGSGGSDQARPSPAPPQYSESLVLPQSLLDRDRLTALNPRSASGIGDLLLCRHDLSIQPAVLRAQGSRTSTSTAGRRTEEARGAEAPIERNSRFHRGRTNCLSVH